jgi:regulator of cell morphogenesis and NO signaling
MKKQDMITGDMSMARVMLENHVLLPLLSRFSIRYGGFGEMSVEEVCSKYGINTDFFLEIANAYLHESYTPSGDFFEISLGDMISYLRKTHDYYLNVAIPHIEKNIFHLVENSGLSVKEKDLVTGFFNDYKKEVLEHISIEEQEVMPYILELEKQSALSHPDREFVKKLSHYSIREFAKEHDRLEYSLENLSKLIIKYLPPFEEQELCVGLLRDMDYLVRDLVDHANMEDKVLVPRVSELEQQVLQKAGIK